jgi:succinate dehydrogenase/fumarate reductase-like Fe-S protein
MLAGVSLGVPVLVSNPAAMLEPTANAVKDPSSYDVALRWGCQSHYCGGCAVC